MKRFLMMAAAAVALAGCGDGGGNPVSVSGTQPNLATGPSGPKKSIYTTQQPASFLSGTSAWAVATRFKASEPGRIVGTCLLGFSSGSRDDLCHRELSSSLSFHQVNVLNGSCGNSSEVCAASKIRMPHPLYALGFRW